MNLRSFMIAISVLMVLLPARGMQAIGAEKKEEAKDGFRLVFSDDFAGKEAGDNWKVLEGSWKISEGRLTGKGQIIINRPFSGYQRVEFSAVSEDPGDLSPFIHSDGSGWRKGYFLQFGGMNNTFNAARRSMQEISLDYLHMAEPGKVHNIVAECDGEYVRLTVDDEIVHQYREKAPLLGKEHERIGFYFYKPGSICKVKVYVKQPSS